MRGLALALALASCTPLARGVALLQAGLGAVEAGASAWRARHGESCEVGRALDRTRELARACEATRELAACLRAVAAYEEAREVLGRAPEGGAEGEGGADGALGPDPGALRAAIRRGD